jgi:Uma2 family endonuclease
MGAIAQILPHYSKEDWERWEDKWEIIYGVPYAMSPAPIPKHQFIASNLNVEFGFALKKCKQCKVYQPIDYVLADDTILQPDLLIVCKKIEKKFLDFAPALVVEILSPSTALKDRHTKYGLYEKHGVKYYLIVSPENENIEVYELIDNEYVKKSDGHNFSFEFTFPEGDCKALIDFADIW